MATNHASDKDAVGALFDRAQGTKAKHDEAAGEGTSRCFEKWKNNKGKGESMSPPWNVSQARPWRTTPPVFLMTCSSAYPV